MNQQFRAIRHGALATIGLFAFGVAPPATAQDAKPQETKGISIKGSRTLPLGVQLPALKGYALQIRMIVLQPGAVAGYHSHAKRPVVAYLVSGDYTEHRDGQGVVAHKPGEALSRWRIRSRPRSDYCPGGVRTMRQLPSA